MPIVERVKGICLKPKDEWQVIAGETTPTAELFKNYAFPLAAIGAVAGFIGMSFVGVSVPFIGSIRTPIISGLVGAAVRLVLSLVGVYLIGLIIDALAPKFGAEKNGAQALKVAVYSFTPGWVAGVLAVIPSLAMLGALAGLGYGVYVMYLGLVQLMKTPNDKAAAYTAVTVLCTLGVFIVVGAVAGAITAPAIATVGLPSGLR